MKRQATYLMLFFVMVLWTSGIMVAKTIGDSMGALEFSFGGGQLPSFLWHLLQYREF